MIRNIKKFPENIDAAYYLIHSMATSSEKFDTAGIESCGQFQNLHGIDECKTGDLPQRDYVMNTNCRNTWLRDGKWK